VFGGKSDQLFVELLGMFASETSVTNDGVWINFHQSTGLSHAIAIDDVFADGNDGIFGQSGAEKNGAVVFGKAFVANPALASNFASGLNSCRSFDTINEYSIVIGDQWGRHLSQEVSPWTLPVFSGDIAFSQCVPIPPLPMLP